MEAERETKMATVTPATQMTSSGGGGEIFQYRYRIRGRITKPETAWIIKPASAVMRM